MSVFSRPIVAPPVAPSDTNQGPYFCSRCNQELLLNKTTKLWESEEELGLCPSRPGKLYGVLHSPSLYKGKPK